MVRLILFGFSGEAVIRIEASRWLALRKVHAVKSAVCDRALTNSQFLLTSATPPTWSRQQRGVSYFPSPEPPTPWGRLGVLREAPLF